MRFGDGSLPVFEVSSGSGGSASSGSNGRRKVHWPIGHWHFGMSGDNESVGQLFKRACSSGPRGIRGYHVLMNVLAWCRACVVLTCEAVRELALTAERN